MSAGLDPSAPPRVSRTRLLAGAVLLVGVAFVQDPGYLIADTKLDLAIDPGGFLGRAAHLWDPQGAFGQVQNQAYGYLWPMGPFFWLGEQIALDAWVVQRLWISLVLVVAFVGASLVTRALGVRGDLGCLLAGFAYALSPRMVSILGGVSIEAWPSAVTPWVLLPLVVGAHRGSPRRAAALSALAVGMVGGVNAAAAAAVLPLGAVWLLTRTRGSRRRSMMLWWPVFTLLATSWWLVPLFVMGAHSPPFLDFIESASVTTFPGTLTNAIRGTTAWIPYVDTGWRAGNDLLRLFVMPLNSGVLLLLGVVGIGLRANPHRFFLAVGLLGGMLMVTLGHTGPVQGWGAAEAQAALDGVLAPLRNVHKFDPVVRLPLVVGLAWSVQSVVEARAGVAPPPEPGVPAWLARTTWRAPAVAVCGLAVIAVAVNSAPVVQGRLAPAGATIGIPRYWESAARWLATATDEGVALLSPGSSFGTYTWGRTGDEPLQSLASSRWAVRNAIPLSPPGTIRMLDAVEARFVAGRPSTGLSGYLRRAGVTHVVVRNDLERAADIADPVLVHQVLRESPGFSRVATFGPEIGGGPTLRRGDRRAVVNGGWQASYPAVEIFAVGQGEVTVTGSAAPPTVVGGPEDLLDLSDLGVLGPEPTTLAVDTPTDQPTRGELMLTDGLLARERFFGRVHEGASAVLLGDEPRRTGNPTRDYRLQDDADRWSTRARVAGVGSVRASSSMSDAANPGGTQPGAHPAAAIDGRGHSSWRSGTGPRQAWWQVDLADAAESPVIRLTAGRLASPQQRLGIVTDQGRSRVFRLGPGETREVQVEGRVSRVRIVGEVPAAGQQLDLAEVRVPGVRGRRSLLTPVLPRPWGSPELILLRRLTETRTACVRVDDEVRCNQRAQPAGAEEPGSMRRVVHLPRARSYPVRLLVTANPRRAEQVAQLGGLTNARASSRAFPDARTSAVAAIDGDAGTSWIAAPDDATPVLRLSWIGEREVRGVRLRLTRSAAARRPTSLVISWPTGTGDEASRQVTLDRRGTARFPPVRTDRMTFELREPEDATDIGFDSVSRPLPLGISEIALLGADVFPVPVANDPLPLGCGSGPTLVVNGRSRVTRVEASAADVVGGRAVPAVPCDGDVVSLRAGTNGLRLSGGRRFLADTVVLGTSRAPGFRSVDARPDGPVRSVLPSPGGEPLLLGMRHNVNTGWSARHGGVALQPQVVDGWRQGWWAPREGGRLVASFTPDATYRAGLMAGGLAVLLLLGLLVVSRRWSSAPSALTERRASVAVLSVLGPLLAGLLAGWPGFVLGAGSVLLVRVLSSRWSSLPWLLGTLPFIATLAYVIRPWGASAGWAGDLAWPDYLLVPPLVGLLVLSGSGVRRRPRFLKRIAGSSTSR